MRDIESERENRDPKVIDPLSSLFFNRGRERETRVRAKSFHALRKRNTYLPRHRYSELFTAIHKIHRSPLAVISFVCCFVKGSHPLIIKFLYVSLSHAYTLCCEYLWARYVGNEIQVCSQLIEGCVASNHSLLDPPFYCENSSSKLRSQNHQAALATPMTRLPETAPMNLALATRLILRRPVTTMTVVAMTYRVGQLLRYQRRFLLLWAADWA